MITKKHINKALKAAILAGEEVLKIYKRDFEVEYKNDHSPVTEADKVSSKIIVDHLKDLEFPILSEEETEVPFSERKNWKALWVVDPLDGTKEFIRKNDEFTINIGFVSDGKPVFGIIYIPVTGEIFYGGKRLGAFKLKKEDFDESIFLPEENNYQLNSDFADIAKKESIVLAGSRSHSSKETEAFINELYAKYNDLKFIKIGSAIKFCRLAEGKIDMYPRFQACMEWDTAAGHAILQGLGKDVLRVYDGKPLVYNKKDLLSPYFIAQ